MRAAVFTLLVFVLATPASALEEAPYEVVEENAAFELRRYPPILVAEVQVKGDFDDVGSEAFRILFRFIRGENQARDEIAMTAPVNQQGKEIAMTAPVNQQRAGEEIAMTAPVNQTAESGSETYFVQFVMPSEYTRETVPVPTDSRIRIRELPPRLIAARRYSGFWRESRFRDQEASLREALSQNGWEAVTEANYARFNAPFSLFFLRRNEVQIEVAPRHGTAEGAS